MESELLTRATQLAQSCEEEFFSVFNSNDGWEDLGVNDGVRGSQKYSESGAQIIKAVGLIPRSCEEIYEFVKDNTKKKSWDEMLEESKVVVQFDPTFRILHEIFNAPWPVSNRDFVFFSKTFVRDDGILMIGRSIDAGVPEISGIVRGEVITSGFYLKRLDSKNTQVTYLISTDPKGMIPNMVKNSVGRKQVSNINKIRDAMAKRT